MSATSQEVVSQGTYSIKYRVKGYNLEAADWDWEHKGRWAVSEASNGGSRWWSRGESSFPDDPSAYIAVLEHFGLLEFWREYEVSEIMFMSPRRLAQERRRHESKNPKLVVKLREEMMTHNSPRKLYAEDYIEHEVEANVQ